MYKAGFEDKLLARLTRLDPDQLRGQLTRLVAQKHFLLTVFDHLDEGVIVTDGHLRLLFANQRARQVLNWPRGKQYLGENLVERTAPDHPLRNFLGSLQGNPRAIEGEEIDYGRRVDRTLAVSTLLMPTPEPEASEEGADEEASLLIILLRDVTERRRRMSEQARAKRLASLATLTSGIAHEIKNPLNSLNIHAQLLQDEIERAGGAGHAIDVERATRAAGVISEETARLGRVIEDFLQAARPRSPRLEPTDLRELFAKAERIFCPECERAGIIFTISIDPDIPLLMLDEHLLLMALRNLVRNAVEAVGEHAERQRETEEPYTPWIRLEAEIAGDAVNITIADNGPGIPEGTLEHIFEPYFTTKFHGTGLGLMVVYRIVTEHRGALNVDTRPGEGTRFTISLPLYQRPVRLLGHEEAGELPVIIRKSDG